MAISLIHGSELFVIQTKDSLLIGTTRTLSLVIIASLLIGTTRSIIGYYNNGSSSGDDDEITEA